MIKKIFSINGKDVELCELTVGQVRKVNKMLKHDEFEATMLMIKMSTGENDKFIDTLAISDVSKLSEWIGAPTE